LPTNTSGCSRDAGLDPPIRTIEVAGKELLEHFGSRTFDIAYASNSLDHSADPFTIISNMSGRAHRRGRAPQA
jgi:hypothetical protein